MALLSGTVHSVQTLKADNVGVYQLAEILFTVTGNYVQADDAGLSAIATLIQNSRRNGKTVTMVGVAPSQSATSGANYLGLKTCAISSANITFEITLNSNTTEYTNATDLPTISRPFGVVIAFTEA